jgi:hypothetical protein
MATTATRPRKTDETGMAGTFPIAFPRSLKAVAPGDGIGERYGGGGIKALPAVIGKPHLHPGVGIVGLDLVEVGEAGCTARARNRRPRGTGMPRVRSITASDVEICSQKPTRLPNRNSSTVSAPAGRGGMSVE